MGVLEGKVAVITGGTSGIGAHTAAVFVKEGAKVVLAGRRSDMGDALVARFGSAASFIRTDVARESDVQAMIAHAVAVRGRIDCLFNNAGTPGRMAGIADIDMDHFDETIAVHVRGVALGMKFVAPAMLQQRTGSIINMASVAGFRAGLTGHAYAAAKAAILQLTRSVAVELGEHGIRVNSIAPGPILTGIFGKGAGATDDAADHAADAAKDAFTTFIGRRLPMPRAGLPEDVAQAALYLASDASSFVNGHTLVIDGGLAAGRKWSAGVADREALARMVRQ